MADSRSCSLRLNARRKSDKSKLSPDARTQLKVSFSKHKIV
jgi:hypothetical protein